MKRGLRFIAASTLIATCVLSLVPQIAVRAGPPSATLPSLGPTPQRCFSLGSSDNICAPTIDGVTNPNWPYAPNGNYLDSTYYGQLNISPHVVEVGQTIEATAEPNLNGKPAWPPPPGPVVSGCENARTNPDYSCSWKAVDASTYPPNKTAAGGGWSQFEMSFTGFFGSGYSADYYYVLPHKAAISGTVTDTQGLPLQDVTVSISGPSSGTATTDKNGFYSALVDPGTYTVTTSIVIDGTSHSGSATACAPGSAAGNTCRITVSDDAAGLANFQFPSESIEGTVTTSGGAPYANITISFTGQTYDGTPVSQTTTTASDGTYTEYLQAGTYTVAPQVPSGVKGTFAPVSCAITTIAQACSGALAYAERETDTFKFEQPLVVNVTQAPSEPDAYDKIQQNIKNGICDVTPDEPFQSCTLAMAVGISNSDGGRYIAFDIPGSGVPIITSDSGISVSAPAVIDGTSQPASSVIELTSTLPNAYPTVSGADFSTTSGVFFSDGSSGAILKGVAITGFHDEVLIAPGVTNVTISSCDLGTAAITHRTNLQDGFFGQNGVVIQGASGNTIGVPGAGNYISSEAGSPADFPPPGMDPSAASEAEDAVSSAIWGSGIVDDTGATSNVIQGNTFTLGGTGQFLFSIQGSNDTVGGTAPGAGNTFSGGGVSFSGAGDVIQGNTFQNAAVEAGPSVQVGGPTGTPGSTPGNTFTCNDTSAEPMTFDFNMTAGWPAAETALTVGNSTVIQGNAFQGGPCMWQALSVLGNGITVGGTSPDDGNLFTHVAGPTNNPHAFATVAIGGASIFANTVQSLKVSSQEPSTPGGSILEFTQGYLDEFAHLYNQFRADAGLNFTGVPLQDSIENNTFLNTQYEAAIDVFQGAGITITQNVMDGNSSGIVLGFNGFVVNTNATPGIGANDALAYPIITGVSIADGQLTLSGQLFTARLGAYGWDDIDLYGQKGCNAQTPSSGQGDQYIGRQEASTGLLGISNFQLTYPASSAADVTATTIDGQGDTSEFSPCVATNSP